MSVSGVFWRRFPVRDAVGIGQLGPIAKGVLRLHQVLRRQSVLLHIRDAQIVASFAALANRRVIETIVGQLVGVVGKFVLVACLTAAVEDVEDSEDDKEADDSVYGVCQRLVSVLAGQDRIVAGGVYF